MAHNIESIDLDQMIRNWALREFDKTATWRQKRLHQKEKGNENNYMGVHIDYSQVKFRDETKWPKLADTTDGATGDGETKTAAGTEKGNVLFQTKFTNNTEDPQEYTLKTEKRTMSSCETVIENTFTRGVEMSVKLMTPGEIFEANAGYSRETSLTNSDGETLEEEVSWGVESQIKVQPRCIAEASLVVDEKKYNGDFIIRTYITGSVLIRFTNIKNDDSFVKAIGCSMHKIFKDFIAMERRKKSDALSFVNLADDKTVIITTKGCCKFRFGVKQEVVVTEAIGD